MVDDIVTEHEENCLAVEQDRDEAIVARDEAITACNIAVEELNGAVGAVL